MTKKEFISKLSKLLKSLSFSQREKHLAFYSELIDDKIDSGMSEAEAVANTDSPESIAVQILSQEPAEPKNKTKLWLFIAASPIILVLGAVAVAIICAALAIAFAAIFSLFAVVVALFALAVGLIVCAALYLTENALTSLMFVGIAFLSLGAAIVLLKPAYRLVIKLFTKFLSALKSIWNSAATALKVERFKLSNKKNEELVSYDEEQKKLFTKKSIITASVSLLLGVVVLVTSFAACGFDANKISPTGENIMRTQDIAAASEATDFFVDTDVSTITIRTTTDSSAHLKYYENKLRSYETLNENGKITFKEIRKNGFLGWFDLVSIFSAKNEIEILLPQSFSGKLTIHSETGTVKIDNLTMLESFELTLTTGNTELNNLKVKDSFFVKTTTGNLKCKNVEADGFTANSTTGNVNCENVKANNFTTNSTTGNVAFSGLVANGITINTTTGSVVGSITGSAIDYKTEAHTITGSNNLTPNLTGTKNLLVTTTTGNINISFK